LDSVSRLSAVFPDLSRARDKRKIMSGISPKTR
jgi:hypothetical protein